MKSQTIFDLSAQFLAKATASRRVLCGVALVWMAPKSIGRAMGPDTTTPQRKKRPAAKEAAEQTGHATKRLRFDDTEGLVMMVTDISEDSCGRFSLWGSTPDGRSVLARVQDFEPYFYFAAPVQPSANGAPEDVEMDSETCARLQRELNTLLPADARITGLAPVFRRPLMYYRPKQPLGSTFLRATLRQGTSVKRVASPVSKWIESRHTGQSAWTFHDTELYEHEVNPLQRFLVDSSISGGAWLHLTPDREGTRSLGSPAVRGGTSVHDGPSGYELVDPQRQVSTCAVEVDAPWRSIQVLTPDATQLADPNWRPQPCALPSSAAQGRWEGAAAAAREGRINELCLMTVDVLAAPADGKERVPVTTKSDPIIAITCVAHSSVDITAKPAVGGAAPELGDIQALVSQGEEEGMDEGLGSNSPGLQYVADEAAGGPQPEQQDNARGSEQTKLVFCWQAGAAEEVLHERVTSTEVRRFGTEQAMLLAWQKCFLELDPDAIYMFEVKDVLGALANRFKVLRLGGGGLFLSRLARATARPIVIRSVVKYSQNWVKSQSRMASNSNQETFRCDNIDGRVVFDILRQVLNGVNLASFSLVDCVQTLLGQRLEVLPWRHLAELAQLHTLPGRDSVHASGSLQGQKGARVADADCLHLARHCAARARVLRALLQRLATIPETVELARATGLTLGNILYNAQMIRTWSLLLRNAQRRGYIVPGRQEPVQLQESPYLMHPVELNTVGLYREPVAVLDFASLYPSLYRAYNLCYSTLIHPEDAAIITQDDTTEVQRPKANAKSLFVKPSLRKGILPSILGALIEARKATRAALKDAQEPTTRAILDSRQKALKLTANALYGFTGAQASNLQSVALADSCLALGAKSTHHARQKLEAVAASGALGPAAEGARVIYAQTDSLFAHFPNASVEEAIAAGNRAGELVSESLPDPLDLKFERVCWPFMMLHVNRYAGRGFERPEDQKGPGTLVVKGLKSMWRQAAPIVRSTLQGSLKRIIMQNDVPSAMSFVEGEVRRLLSGHVESWETVMTGGLWRVTGQQIAGVAAAEAEADEDAPPAPTPGKAGAKGVGKGTGKGADASPPEDVRGPHASLAVRLTTRDPGRAFVLGERLNYVLLPGQRTQDDAAEDPLTAVKALAQPDYELYWKNKLQRPLKEMFAVCVSPTQLNSLLQGMHTSVHVDLTTAPAAANCSEVNKRKGKRQLGMQAFYKSTLRCLGCRRSMPGSRQPGMPADVEGPGLCEACAAIPDKLPEVYLEYQKHVNEFEAHQAQALSYCASCHSGGLGQPVVCENGECPVLYARIESAARLTTVSQSLARLDW